MKNLFRFCFGVATVALLATACNETEPISAGDGNGVLTVKIKSAESATRALIDGNAITSGVVELFEDNVADFTAYVFNWNTGDLEAKADAVLTGGTLKATITGLNTAGTKRVVVIANGKNLTNSSIPAFVNNPNYERLAEGYVDLRDQSFTSFGDLTRGFLMTGENAPDPNTGGGIQLSAGENNSVVIPVERVVAKIQLGNIEFDSSVSLSDLANFNLTGATIQRAIGTSTLAPGPVTATSSTPTWYGGVVGSISETTNTALGGTTLNLSSFLQTLLGEIAAVVNPTVGAVINSLPAGNTLSELLAQAAGTLGGTLGSGVTAVTNAAGNITGQVFSAPAFWYVLPNDDVNTPTLLTLEGTYEGTKYYYPIEINTPASNASANSGDDGKGLYIKRNTIYTINVKFHGFVGTSNPDEPGKMATMTVTVAPVAWHGPIVQNTAW